MLDSSIGTTVLRGSATAGCEDAGAKENVAWRASTKVSTVRRLTNFASPIPSPAFSSRAAEPSILVSDPPSGRVRACDAS